jgi:hypothetical protein
MMAGIPHGRNPHGAVAPRLARYRASASEPTLSRRATISVLVVSPNALLAIILGPAAAFLYLISARASIKRLRTGDEEWRQRWRELDPDRRKAIRARMKSGEAVQDHEDAELSLRAIAQVNYVRKAMAPMSRSGLLLVVLVLVVGVITDSVVFLALGVFGLGSGAVFDLLARRQRKRYQRSATATKRIHGMNSSPPH